MNTEEPVMYIIIRSDLGMNKGKIAAQAGHAVQLVIQEIDRDPRVDWHETQDWYMQWRGGSYAKVVLRIDSEDEIANLHKNLTDANILHCLVVDEGRTQVASNSTTALGIQPMPRGKLSQFVGTLKLL